MKRSLLIACLLAACLLLAVACTKAPAGTPGDTTADITADITADTTAAVTPGEEDTTTPAEETTPAAEETTPKAEETTPAEPETTVPEPETEGVPSFFGPDNLFVPEDQRGSTEKNVQHILDMTVGDGSLTITPDTKVADPYYFPMRGWQVTGGRYVAIKYRAQHAENTSVQIYIGTSATAEAPVDDSTSLEVATISDGQWHIAVFDTQPLIEKGLYDGKTVSFFRFDPLNANYKLNDEGEPYQEDNIWVRHPMDEQATIDIAYLGFYNNAEDIETEAGPTLLSCDKGTYTVGEAIMVTAVGEGTDWIGLAHKGDTASIRWVYLAPVEGYIAAQSGTPYNIAGEANTNPGKDPTITPGQYTVYLMPDDQNIEGNTPLAAVDIMVVAVE